MTANDPTAGGEPARHRVADDAMSDLAGNIAAWTDDYPARRCASSHRLSGRDGDVSIRCDGQAGHAGRHQGDAGGSAIYWDDHPDGP